MIGSAWFQTLGCKANQYESRSLQAALGSLGWGVAADPSQADLVVVNTCAVTAAAERKSRQVLGRVRRLAPGARVVALGCLVAAVRTRGEEVAEVDFALAEGARPEGQDRFLAWLGSGPADSRPRAAGVGRRTRALLMVQDGCDACCTYCVIPSLRGPSRARPCAEVLAEARLLWEAGVPEVVLTGVCLGAWSQGGLGLHDLVRALASLPGRTRLRLSSLEPEALTSPLLEVMAEAGPERICPHLHLPLQHGSDRILRRMGRPYRLGPFLETVAEARRLLAEPALSTDVIVGFPGEQEADLEATLSALVCLEPIRVHVFPFSPRQGTPACRLPDPLPPAVIRERAGRVRSLSDALACQAARCRVGRLEDVVLQRGGAGLSGRYLKVHLDAGRPGERLQALVTSSLGPELFGRRQP